MNQLGTSSLYSTFDCSDFFFQNRLRDEDAWMTAFCTVLGQFEWRVCPQGLVSSPAVAQRLFSGILRSMPCVNDDMSKHPWQLHNLLVENAVVFLDDALVHAGAFEEHLDFVWLFMYVMEDQDLHLSASKTQFIRPQCNYLGHFLSSEGVAVQPERVAALRDWPVPKSTTNVRTFLGFCVCLRRHIEGFGAKAAPLSALPNQTAVFSWGPAEQRPFEGLRDLCSSPSVLSTPKPGLSYQVRCDASGFVAGYGLWQLHTMPNGTTLWRPIEFRSKSFNEAERRKVADEREVLSFVGALKYFKNFLAGVPFSVITDSTALAWLHRSKEPSPCFQRWWTYVSSFTFTIQHRPGKRIVKEDALSRRPNIETTTNPEDMLSLSIAEDCGLPEPTGTAPASLLAASLVLPSYVRPPMDRNGVLVSDQDQADDQPLPIGYPCPTCLPEY